MQKIIPFLWFEDRAEEAVHFYTSIFKDSSIISLTRYGDEMPGPKGKVMSATFELAGQQFIALNGGPAEDFKFSPAISFFVNCETREELDALWQKLSQDGTVLMEPQEYPFSERFGWVADRFGISWQLNLSSRIWQLDLAGRIPKITPFLMFVGKRGKAEEAIEFYTHQFKHSSIVSMQHYGAGEDGPAGTVKHALFILDGQAFMAIDSNVAHAFGFTPAISFFVKCETQKEIDKLWEKLLDGGKEQQCGWLTDRYGVTWQIVPTVLGEMLSDPDPEKAKRVTEAMLKMVKLDIAGLKQAYGDSAVAT